MSLAMPVYELTPLEYRVGMDAASVWLAGHAPLRLICDQPALLPECEQRLRFDPLPPWGGALWLEPQQESWMACVPELADQLSGGARLALLLSMPPARYLPERRAWDGAPLGQQPGGLQSLLHTLHRQGFAIDVAQALHTRRSVILNLATRVARILRGYALADRLEFAARRRYIQPLERSWQATCALLLAHRP